MDQKIVGRNTGESANEWKGHKTPYQLADIGNRAGAESGVSPESEWSATAGEHAPLQNPSGEINISADTSNRAAQFKYPSRSQDQGAGANQYE
jgi:hypothetical protein